MRRISGAILAIVLSFGCSTRPQQSTGNTNWLTCTADSECGDQICQCGYCSDRCSGVLECSLGPQKMCVSEDSHDGGGELPADGAAPAADAGADGGLDYVGTPLADTVSMAFKSGYGSAEQIWLRDVSDNSVQVSGWDPSPMIGLYSSWSTSGYPEGSGRFGTLRFDHSGAFLLFRETLDDQDPSAPGLERMVAYEVATGRARELLRTSRNAIRGVIVGEDATVLVVDSSDTEPVLYDFDSGTATRIDVPTGSALSLLDRPISPMPRFGGRSQLLVDGIPPLEKAPGGWVLSTAFSGVVGTWFSVAASAAGDRLCVVGRLDATTATGVGYILGGPTPVQVSAESYGSCMFAASGSQVYFPSNSRIEAHLLDGTTLWSLADASLFGEASGKLYVSQTDAIATVDPATGALLDTVLPNAGTVAGCGGPGSAQIVFLPRGTDPTALVKVSCGCTDCDISGTVAVRLDTFEVTIVEQPIANGDHAVYSALRAASGDFVLASTQVDNSSGVPAPGSFFLIHQQGGSELVGPLPGVTGFIHGLMAPGPEGLEAAGMDWWW